MIRKSKFFSIGKTGDGYCSYDFNGEIGRMNIKMRDGRTLSFFVNRKSGLLVGNVIDKDEKGGYEFLRRNLNTIPTRLGRVI